MNKSIVDIRHCPWTKQSHVAQPLTGAALPPLGELDQTYHSRNQVVPFLVIYKAMKLCWLSQFCQSYYSPLCVKMMLPQNRKSNVLHRCQSQCELQPKATCTENLMKHEHVVFKISSWTDTDKYTDHSNSQVRACVKLQVPNAHYCQYHTQHNTV